MYRLLNSSRNLKLSIFLLLLGVFLIFAAVYSADALTVSHTVNETPVEFEIKPGQTINEVFIQLEKEGIIEPKRLLSLPVYRLYLNSYGPEYTVQAGKYTIEPKTSIHDLFNLLSKGRCREVSVTILEGLRMEEIATILEKKLGSSKFNVDNFMQLARNFNGMEISEKLDFDVPPNLEGFLFPDTYSFCDQSTDEKIVIEKFLSNFNLKVINGIPDIKSHELPLYDIIKIASMLERESQKYEEMEVIAGILIKRLKSNIPLGVDATAQYGFGFSQKEQTWWPKGNDLIKAISEQNDYNTRIVLGLPPTPISNPGIKSIKAVLNRKDTNYLYYLHDDCGNIHYSRTISEHNRKAAMYIGNGCKTLQ